MYNYMPPVCRKYVPYVWVTLVGIHSGGLQLNLLAEEYPGRPIYRSQMPGSALDKNFPFVHECI